METYRLAVRPTEVLYLERECPECHRITTLSPSTIDDPGAALRTLREACLWCNAPVDGGARNIIGRFLLVLHDLQSLDAPALSLVVRRDVCA